MAAQFSLTKVPFLRPDKVWIARAMSSLPVPVSPQIMTVESVGATVSTSLSDLLQRRALADDLLEVVLELALEVELLARDLVLEGLDLAEGKCVLDGGRDLVRDLHEELDVGLAEIVFPLAGDVETTESLSVREERSTCRRTESVRDVLVHGGVLVCQQLGSVPCNNRLACLQRTTRGRLAKRPWGPRHIPHEGVVASVHGRVIPDARRRMVHEQARVLVTEDPLQARVDRAEQFWQVEVRVDGAGEVEEEPEPVALLLVGLRAPRPGGLGPTHEDVLTDQ